MRAQSLLQKWIWFIGLWFVGIGILGSVAFLIRWVLL